ncbi:MAG: methyltransferase domain-containing protein [Planctomycetes bacterium]|nr:methyltransferase domain-containing protein [Planctomycetota bacterium]
MSADTARAPQPKRRETCPGCGAPGPRSFHRVESAPVHSCLLMASAAQAASYPTGGIDLAFCASCGFISNLIFDPAAQEYSPQYEETQHFSPLFNAFAEDLARRLIERFDVRGRTILEVGCGKGEFLDVLCRLGGNRGVGIDPGARPERFSAEALERFTLVRDWFARGFRPIPHDVFVCRHTLEHAGETREFVSAVREYVGARPDALVFFEVPDTGRVLREQAFWDVYYEHCSYFTPGSLARLFRSCGFEILELELDFAGQYILLMARPAPGPTAPRFPLEDDLAQTRREVELFEREFPGQAAAWRRRVRAFAGDGLRPVVWGGGSKCVAFFTALGIGREIEYVVDVNPHKQGKYLPGTGHEVVAPAFLESYRPRVVLLMNAVYREEVSRMLRSLGIDAELVAV